MILTSAGEAKKINKKLKEMHKSLIKIFSHFLKLLTKWISIVEGGENKYIIKYILSC